MGQLDADLAVVGAGPAGAAAALFVARRGRGGIPVGRAIFPRGKGPRGGLIPGGGGALGAAGLGGAVGAGGASATDRDQFGLVGRAQGGGFFPGYRGEQAGIGVRRLDFDQRLIEAVVHEPRISFHERLRALEGRRLPAGPTGITTTGELPARHVVVADGARPRPPPRPGGSGGPRPPPRHGGWGPRRL